jgi:hypothetical protein
MSQNTFTFNSVENTDSHPICSHASSSYLRTPGLHQEAHSVYTLPVGANSQCRFLYCDTIKEYFQYLGAPCSGYSSIALAHHSQPPTFNSWQSLISPQISHLDSQTMWSCQHGFFHLDPCCSFPPYVTAFMALRFPWPRSSCLSQSQFVYSFTC